MKKNLIFMSLALCSFVLQNDKALSTEEYKKLNDEDKRSVAKALDGIDLMDEGLEVSLFAAEPQLTNPTNMDIDEKGRVWICEAYNYRNQLNPRNPYQPKGDRILILEDTDGDGKADKTKVFYQGEDINAALGIAVLGNKTYVSCSPNVFVFTDTNGDDIPDTKEIMFTGVKGKQHDHGMHALVFGPDGKLYFNFGNAGEGIQDKDGKSFKDDKGRTIDASKNPYQEGMVFRSDMNGKNLEILGWNFRNNYELALDSYGRMWQSDNDDDGNRGTRINYVMDYGNYGFKDEMTGADWRVRRTNMEDSVYQKHWHLNDPGVVPNMLQTYAGSPTGILLYEGNLLPSKYQNKLIHCDAGPNVVRSYAIAKNGAGFSATINKILDGSKKDNWFRPSDVTVAPDGSIFISDWYDPGVGGHAMGDSLRGRVFRVAPKGHKYKVPSLDLSTVEGSMAALNSANQATRFLGYQALSKAGKGATTALKAQLDSKSPYLAARAYWLLSALDSDYIDHASKRTEEDLRVLAVRMARTDKIDRSEFFTKLASDPSIQVRREVALAIRHKNMPNVWAKLASEYNGNDRWYLEALGIAAADDWDNCLKALKAKEGEDWLKNENVRELVWRSRGSETNALLAEIIKSTPEAEKAKYYRSFDFQSAEGKNKALLGLLRTSGSANEKMLIFKHFDQKTILKDPLFLTALPVVLKGIKNDQNYLELVSRYQLKSEFARVHKIAMTNKNAEVSKEAAAVSQQLFGTKGLLMEIKNKVNVKEALKRYGSVDQKEITTELVKVFENKSLAPDVRKIALEQMAGYNSEVVLWEKVKSNTLAPEFTEKAIDILKRTWHSDIRNEVSKLAVSNNGIINVEKILASKGSAVQGKEVFSAYCSTCHLMGNTGNDFGPNLSQIGAKLSKQGLLNSVLYPSEGVSFGYEGSTIYFKNGQSTQGIVTSKTENDLMVKYAGSGMINILKLKDISKIEPMKESVMPKFPLNEKELADLTSFMEGLK